MSAPSEQVFIDALTDGMGTTARPVPAARITSWNQEWYVQMPADDIAPIWWFVATLVVTWFGLAGLLALAARRQYYFHLVPFVAGFAVLAPLLLRLLGLQGFTLWYLGLTALALFAGLVRHLSSQGGRRALADLRKHVLDAVPEGEIKQHVAKELGPSRAIIQDAIVDVAVLMCVPRYPRPRRQRH
jgi:hypothetical protein